MWGDRSRPFKTNHGLNRREALWSAVAAATAFSESKCIRVMAAARAQSGSCCDRTPKPASPAARAPTSNSDPQDRSGCGSAALRYAFCCARRGSVRISAMGSIRMVTTGRRHIGTSRKRESLHKCGGILPREAQAFWFLHCFVGIDPSVYAAFSHSDRRATMGSMRDARRAGR
jgi:hypothetical protein